LLTHLQAQGNNEKCCQTSTCRKLLPEHCIERNEEIDIGEKRKRHEEAVIELVKVS
jgi:hypothetical protein